MAYRCAELLPDLMDRVRALIDVAPMRLGVSPTAKGPQGGESLEIERPKIGATSISANTWLMLMG